MIRSFSQFKLESRSDVKLVLAGPNYWGMQDIYTIINQCGVKEDVIFTGRLPDEELALVLGSALALTFIPYYEGFGIPLLEAMAAEVPIIAGNNTSLPEVAGEAALLVNQNNTDEIKQAMLRLYQDKKLQKDLIEKGGIQKQRFSWDKSAELLWESILKTTGQ